MSAKSRSLLFVGSIFLIHAAYSAHEFYALTKNDAALNDPETLTSIIKPFFGTSSSSGGPTPTALPLDIVIETLVSVIILCVALVLGQEELRPFSWRVWASQVERGQRPAEEGYGWLERGQRKGFLDIRAQRKEFAQWAKSETSKDSKT